MRTHAVSSEQRMRRMQHNMDMDMDMDMDIDMDMDMGLQLLGAWCCSLDTLGCSRCGACGCANSMAA